MKSHPGWSEENASDSEAVVRIIFTAFGSRRRKGQIFLLMSSHQGEIETNSYWQKWKGIVCIFYCYVAPEVEARSVLLFEWLICSVFRVLKEWVLLSMVYLFISSSLSAKILNQDANCLDLVHIASSSEDTWK